MSGHSHYATIKRQKEVKDAQKGKIFSKLVRAISIAARSGTDPETNYKLRVAIEAAKRANMPKENIEKAIKQAEMKSNELEEITYEGFGPGGIAVLVEVATDNRNRTVQEIKNIFERGGGSLTGPGSTSFNFETKGLILVKKNGNVQDQILKLIDMGVEDVEEVSDAIEVYVGLEDLSSVKDRLENNGFQVLSFEVTKKPKNVQPITDPQVAEKALRLLERLEEHDDVQRVYTNLDIEEGLLKNIQVPN